MPQDAPVVPGAPIALLGAGPLLSASPKSVGLRVCTGFRA